jgi:hypothetical protein
MRNRVELQVALAFIDGTMNTAKYTVMLTEYLVIERLHRVNGPNKWVFQDAGANSHRARMTKEWLSSRCLNVSSKEFNWSANSPDLNAVEHVRSIVKSGVEDAGIENEERLCREARRVWDSIPIAAVNPAGESFANKLQGVQGVGGQSLNGHRKIL